MKKSFKIMSKRGISLILALAMLITYFMPITYVFAKDVAPHGEGEEHFTFDMDANGFPVSSVTINGYEWNKDYDHIYYTEDGIYTIVIKAGKKGDAFPWISTAGGLDDYKVYTAIENPEENPEIDGDECILTLVFTEEPEERQKVDSLGISLQEGPFPVLPEIAGEADITITVIGDELEYHYVEDKPDEADVCYFKFGINSGISDDIVPFTFGNANYTYNDNPAPHNVSSVTTKEPIHYEYNYDGTGFVTFYINGGGTDEYTRIEINGVDYSNRAPHTQVEVFEHFIGWASVFEIEGVPYNADGYNVVVEGRKVTDEKTVAGFGWSYLNRERSNLPEDEAEGNFAHGRLEFVQAKYTDIDEVEHVFNSVEEYNNARFHDTGEIYMWHDGRKDYEEEDRRQAWGEASVPYGTELTVRVVPDEGYQLTNFSTSPDGFQATDEPGVYKIVLTKENFRYEEGGFDLTPEFTEIGNEVRADSEKVKGGAIDIDTQVENGTIKLEVNDVNVSNDSREAFEERAEEEGYEINNYVDLSLYNAIYKGGKKDDNNNYLSWDTEINNLTQAATITLELEDNMERKELAVIHEKGENDYELIEANYNAETNSIIFETNSFSNYAIVARDDLNNGPEGNICMVTFNTNGGSEIEPIAVERGHSIEEPEKPAKEGATFEGWYEDATFTTRFNFDSTILDDTIIYVKWNEEEIEEPEEKEEYELTSGNITFIFTDEADNDFEVACMDVLKLSDEELEVLEITREEFNEILEVIKENTKKYGTVLSVYAIEIESDRRTHEGETKIIFKMTDELKKYNTFKLIYLNEENGFEVEEVVDLEVEGDYIVGVVPHLSAYALVADNVEKTNNTKTGDTITLWVGLMTISVLGIAITKRISK